VFPFFNPKEEEEERGELHPTTTPIIINLILWPVSIYYNIVLPKSSTDFHDASHEEEK